jgi:hypothetical protein
MTIQRACALLLALSAPLCAELVFAAPALADPGVESHQLTIRLDPKQRRFEAKDEMRVRRGGGGTLTLRLNSGLAIRSVFLDGAVVEDVERISDNGVDANWAIPIPDGESRRVLLSASYSGSVWQALGAVVPPGGALLPDEASWIPRDDQSTTWTVRLDLPQALHGIMQGARGERTVTAGRAIESWSGIGETRRFDLALTPFAAEERRSGDRTIAVWRAEKGEDGATLLDLAETAITRYEALFGPYPLPRLDIVAAGVGRAEPGLAITSGAQQNDVVRTEIHRPEHGAVRRLSRR